MQHPGLGLTPPHNGWPIPILWAASLCPVPLLALPRRPVAPLLALPNGPQLAHMDDSIKMSACQALECLSRHVWLHLLCVLGGGAAAAFQ